MIKSGRSSLKVGVVAKIFARFMHNYIYNHTILKILDPPLLFPTSLAYTDLRPFVVYSCLAKTAIVLELTICFETNVLDAKQRKVTKYSKLVVG